MTNSDAHGAQKRHHNYAKAGEALFEQHRSMLDGALEAIATRAAHSAFIESPSQKHHPEGAHEKGRAAFFARLNNDFVMAGHPESTRPGGEEISPYTAEPLGIRYPRADAKTLIDAGERARRRWSLTTAKARTGICLEILARLAAQQFEHAYATMHTGGQAFMMAFAGSGANSLDRGLEAVAYAHRAVSAILEHATFSRRFGRGESVTLDKTTRTVGLGHAAVLTCASYPAFNAYPAVFANLVAGNLVAVKPHPQGTLPMAMLVQTCRDVLDDCGLHADVVTLAADLADKPIATELCDRPEVRIIDFTGSQTFGAHLEERYPEKQVYTETSGCNAVVLESAHDLDAVLAAIAQSIALFSAQMCTAAQNIFIPRAGVRVGDDTVSFDEVKTRLGDAVDALCADPKTAGAVCGALATTSVLDNIETLRTMVAPDIGQGAGIMLRDAAPYPHPEFPNARTATPMLVEVDADASDIYRREHFGPMAFVIKAKDRQHALMRATTDARTRGAISSYLYSVDEAFIDTAEDAFFRAGANLGINLVRQLPINFAAAYSDLHVTGLNPAGNATLCDASFVAQRFRRVQSKRERPLGDPPNR